MWCHLLLLSPVFGLGLFFIFPWTIAIPSYLVVLAVSFLLYRKIVQSMNAPVVTGREGLLGQVAQVGPGGTLKLHGERWTIEGNGENLPEGEWVRIVGVDGLRVRVQPLDRRDRDEDTAHLLPKSTPTKGWQQMNKLDKPGFSLEQPVKRRGFLKYVLFGFAAMVTAIGTAVPVVSYLWPPRLEGSSAGGRVAVGSTADLPVGKGSVYSVQNRPVIVIHIPDGYRALSAVCTHLGCIVYWDESRHIIACPCHEGYFNINGSVISGPPPRPLPVYRVQVEDDQIFVDSEPV
jgi:cytochrome b6-f complex iron-sulfur subunit